MSKAGFCLLEGNMSYFLNLIDFCHFVWMKAEKHVLHSTEATDFLTLL
jgi:hypothetical protein